MYTNANFLFIKSLVGILPHILSCVNMCRQDIWYRYTLQSRHMNCYWVPCQEENEEPRAQQCLPLPLQLQSRPLATPVTHWRNSIHRFQLYIDIMSNSNSLQKKTSKITQETFVKDNSVRVKEPTRRTVDSRPSGVMIPWGPIPWQHSWHIVCVKNDSKSAFSLWDDSTHTFAIGSSM